MSVFSKLREMMKKDTRCGYSRVSCAECIKQNGCDILEKYLGEKKEG